MCLLIGESVGILVRALLTEIVNSSKHIKSSHLTPNAMVIRKKILKFCLFRHNLMSSFFEIKIIIKIC